MEPRESTEHLRKEHLEILRLTERFEDALSLASREDFAARQIGLAELRALQHGLLGISQHCTSEDGILESDYHHYLDAQKYDRIRTQHESLSRLIASLLRELPFVTADSVVDVVPRGEDIVDRIREHVAYEEEMLGYIEDLRLQMR
ncbi:MAG TPA: hemerythrin domain-containing protein [Candidatus Acidoferrales bacterium]|nr:hemerythrin domain-containing protein [Candidatus Acidoferrales bacterium]